MGTAILGLVVDSSAIIEAERNRQTVDDLLTGIREVYGEVEICMSAVTVAELVHGVGRARTSEIRRRRRAFIDELKMHVPVHPVTEASGEIAGKISGEQAAIGVKIPLDDLLIAVAALEQGYAVMTLNSRHFQLIPGLVIVRSPSVRTSGSN